MAPASWLACVRAAANRMVPSLKTLSLLEGEKAYQHSTKKLFNDPNPPARRLSVEGLEELSLGGAPTNKIN
jgi:hypothetical protein